MPGIGPPPPPAASEYLAALAALETGNAAPEKPEKPEKGTSEGAFSGFPGEFPQPRAENFASAWIEARPARTPAERRFLNGRDFERRLGGRVALECETFPGIGVRPDFGAWYEAAYAPVLAALETWVESGTGEDRRRLEDAQAAFLAALRAYVETAAAQAEREGMAAG